MKRNLNSHAEYLRKDNTYLRLSDVELSQKEIESSAEERGISVYVENSKELLDQWVEAEEKIQCNGKLLSVSIYKTLNFTSS